MVMLVTTLLSAVAAASGSDFPSFDDFVRVRSRNYRNGTKEFSERRTVYEASIKFALWQNTRPGRLWTAGVNNFADWNDVEISSLFGWSGNARPTSRGRQAVAVKKHGFLQKQNKSNQTYSSYVNWVASGGMTNQGLGTLTTVRDQGPCGSCWAIAAATTLEAAVEVHRKDRIPFSAQQIIDCVPNPQECGGQGGCRGATVELAFEWILANGIQGESDNRYRGATKACATRGELSAASFGMYDWEMLPRNKYPDLLQALMQGPVAVSVAATGWVHYMNGVFDSCPNEAIIDHAVVSYGYGEENGVKFWHIQNSWGMWWGETGRMRLLRTDDDESKCGWNTEPKKGTGCTGGDEKVWVCGECGVLYDSVIAHIHAK